MKRIEIKDVSSRTISRLTNYLTILREVIKTSPTISSEDLSKIMNTTSAQVRKDLSTFGEFGTRGKGYDIKKLIKIIEKILGIDKNNDIILIGYGNMGHMISSNTEVLGKGFKLVGVFDGDDRKVGKSVLDTDMKVKSTSELDEFINKNKIEIAILSVTSESAQNVANDLVKAGIKAILNLTAYKLVLDTEISVVNVDISAKLQELNFWKNHSENPKSGTM